MKFIFFLVILFTICGCAISRNNYSPDSNNIDNQIQHIDAQMVHLESMISSARARQMSGLENNSVIESEIANFESQKASLLLQKKSLQQQKGN